MGCFVLLLLERLLGCGSLHLLLSADARSSADAIAHSKVRDTAKRTGIWGKQLSHLHLRQHKRYTDTQSMRVSVLHAIYISPSTRLPRALRIPRTFSFSLFPFPFSLFPSSLLPSSSPPPPSPPLSRLSTKWPHPPTF